jgi:hypothetical protein
MESLATGARIQIYASPDLTFSACHHAENCQATYFKLRHFTRHDAALQVIDSRGEQIFDFYAFLTAASSRVDVLIGTKRVY